MQLPETPPPPLAPLWDRILRARALPPDLDIELLYVAIRDRLTHPEWEVRLHALRVLADLLPLSGNALSFPFDQVVDNLGHSSPNVRKAALDALKVFCTHCEDSECATRAILDKCSYQNIRPHSANLDNKVNVITGLILSIPSLIGILKRRHVELDIYPVFKILGEKLFDPIHRDVAQRSLIKLRRVCGARDYMMVMTRLDPKIQEKFRILCETYDEDSLDVYYAPRKSVYQDIINQPLVKINHVFNGPLTAPLRISTDSSSEDSYARIPFYNNNYAKVIIETEIKFDSDTAITMTVLEENETESDKYIGSDEDYDSSDLNMLKYSDGDTEDTDVVVKKVRFGGESVKIRTPDSDNIITSEDDNRSRPALLDKPSKEEILDTHASELVSKIQEIKQETNEKDSESKNSKRSGIPLPVIHNKPKEITESYSRVKLKSKSLSELYDYFKTKNNIQDTKSKPFTGFSLTLTEVHTPEKVPSPVESHREVEVLHNLQRSPVASPRRQQTRVHLEKDGLRSGYIPSGKFAHLMKKIPSPMYTECGIIDDIRHVLIECVQNANLRKDVICELKLNRLDVGMFHSILAVPTKATAEMLWKLYERFVLSLLSSSSPNEELISPRPATSLKAHYDWEELGIVPQYTADQLHNTENWIAAVKAADQLHSILLEGDNVRRVEPAALSLVQHMWALSDAVAAARAPAEGAVCTLVRAASNGCIRELLPILVSRMAREPLPTALPHALLQRLALHHLVDLIFDPEIIRESQDIHRMQSAQLRATLCLARAAGPAAVLSAVRRRLAGTTRADMFCNKLRERLSRPIENVKPSHNVRSSQLPVPVRRRARSTPPPAGPPPPRRLRPLPDSAPLPGNFQQGRDIFMKPLSPIPLSDKDSSALTSFEERIQFSAKKSLSGKHEKIDNNNIEHPPRSPSIKVEEYSQRSNPSSSGRESRGQSTPDKKEIIEAEDIESHKSATTHHGSGAPSRRGSPISVKSRSGSPASAKSGSSTPDPTTVMEPVTTERERDVRAALAECIVPPRHENWEAIVTGLVETERLAGDMWARAPATSWRAAVRGAAAHVRSLRSRVARVACRAVGALFEHRGRLLDPELEEAASALLERCADANRFLRADATEALGRVACGSGLARAAVALARRGATHRAGPVRAAAAASLSRLVRHASTSKTLDLPPEPRTVLLRATGELLTDASPEARMHARHLVLALSKDIRFRPLLKEAMPPTRYRAVEKFIDKL